MTAAQLADARAALVAARRVNAFYAEQNVSLKRQLAAARSWLVAPDGSRNCARCGREIQRGQAYELLPTNADLPLHALCPEPPI